METIAEILAPHETLEAYAPGRVLFREGQNLEGIYFLHSGEVDLCFYSPKNRDSRTLRIAKTGEILGLTSIMARRPHDYSATTRTTCITGYIQKDRFLKLLEERPDLWLTVLQTISVNVNSCWDCMRTMAGAR